MPSIHRPSKAAPSPRSPSCRNFGVGGLAAAHAVLSESGMNTRRKLRLTGSTRRDAPSFMSPRFVPPPDCGPL